MNKCTFCGKTVYPSSKYCPSCGNKLEPVSFPNPKLELKESLSDNSQRNQLITILLLIFLYPVGLPYMWVSKPFAKKTRLIITICFLGAVFLGLMMIILWTTSPGYSI
ncbi:MAG TPA: hypothetical protein DD618_02245 [Acholeplasmatales bacterium]|nr:hypothetical protein [Acholeplasmatales bacterium]